MGGEKWTENKVYEGFPYTEGEKKLGNCLRLCSNKSWFMEIPYGELKLGNMTWWRTHHGGGPHFNYQWNKDGTISPKG